MAKRPDKKAESAGSVAFAAVGGSLAELADTLGCSKSSVSRWRTGVKSPGPSMKTKISDAFGIDDLLWGVQPGEVPRTSKPTTARQRRERQASKPLGFLGEIVAQIDEIGDILGAEPCDVCEAPNLTDGMRAKYIDSRTRLLALKGKTLKDVELLEDRLVKEHPAWRRLLAGILAAVKKHPRAMKAILDVMGEEGVEA